jgi:hypothetical protein
MPLALVGFALTAAAWVAVVLGPMPAGADDKPADKPVAKQEAEAKKPATPSHRVIACYFHRTVRCDTCKRISAYIEEAVKEKLAAEVKDGRVKVVMIDFQNPANQAYTNSFKITGPTLVIMDVRDDLVKAWKPAPKVWALVADKKAFFQYVEDEVRGLLDAKKKPEKPQP